MALNLHETIWSYNNVFVNYCRMKSLKLYFQLKRLLSMLVLKQIHRQKLKTGMFGCIAYLYNLYSIQICNKRLT